MPGPPAHRKWILPLAISAVAALALLGAGAIFGYGFYTAYQRDVPPLDPPVVIGTGADGWTIYHLPGLDIEVTLPGQMTPVAYPFEEGDNLLVSKGGGFLVKGRVTRTTIYAFQCRNERIAWTYQSAARIEPLLRQWFPGARFDTEHWVLTTGLSGAKIKGTYVEKGREAEFELFSNLEGLLVVWLLTTYYVEYEREAEEEWSRILNSLRRVNAR